MATNLDQQISELIALITDDEAKTTLTELLQALQFQQEAGKLLKSSNNHPEKAFPLLEKAIMVNWPSWLAWHRHGLALYRLKRHTEAIPSYQKSIALNDDKNWKWSCRHLVECYDHTRQYEAGWLYFDELVKTKPDWWLAWHERGYMARQSKRLDEAILSYKKAIKLRTDDCESSAFGLVETIRKLGTTQTGLAHFTELTKKFPDKWPLWHYQGWFQWKCDIFGEAEVSLRRTIRLHPQGGKFTSWLYLASMYYQLNRFAEAVEAFTEAISRGKGDSSLWEAWKGLGDSRKQLQQYKEAISAYEEAVKLKRRLPEIYFSLGTCLEKDNQLARAFESYSQSLQADSTYEASGTAQNTLVVTLRSKLLEFVDKRFDREDLRTLCFHLHVDYDNLPANGKYGKARELIAHQEKISDANYHAILNLINEIRAMRPGIPLP